MPELPEVETFVRNLAPALGATIVAARVDDPRLALAEDDLRGRTIAGIRRRGKHIVMSFGDGSALIVHLRMSGRLRMDRSEKEVAYTRLTLSLDSGQAVYFVNPRRLGTATFCERGAALDLGVEPLGAEFTVDALARLVKASRAPIKQVLLDQRKIAGIGNIYAAEALWHAGIDPRRPASSLTEEETASLHRAVRSVLRSALEQMGTNLGSSVSDYRPTADGGAMFQNHLAVYGREGAPCERCGKPIDRVVQAGRSTCYCPCCQT